MTLVYIPIKEHSQRVPHKNFRMLGGEPLWERAVKKFASEFSVYVDTDSMEIGDKCENMNNVTAFYRPVTLQGDDVSVCNLIRNFIKTYDIDDVICQLHVTSPFLELSTIENAFRNMRLNDSVVACDRIQARFWREEGYGYCPVNHNPVILEQTQDLPVYYQENSAFYIFDAKQFLQTNMRVGLHPYFYVVGFPENVDIDNEEDWSLCNVLHKLYL